MKRTITVMLTVAMVGSLMFMGFAGTAAADSHTEIDIDLGGDGGDGGDAVNAAEVNQQNNNAQVGASSAVAVGDGDDHKKGYDSGGAAAASIVDQGQAVEQTNYADVDQYAFGGDGGDGGDFNFSIGFDD
ncbi:hypothetical protein [Natrononativus amylolyticus]|uniref:hypothetical protein n=1 Tax=Natrononativus amylolyticus TaxID=2963434 RepID=UPI0020CC57AA|nr:hypothetical protein [Natrononativus amylolyticus]